MRLLTHARTERTLKIVKRHLAMALASLGLVVLLVTAPCRVLFLTADASAHACCDKESEQPARDVGCQSRCAAVAKEANHAPQITDDGSVVMVVVDEGPRFVQTDERPVALASESPPHSPLYLKHSSLLI